MMPKKAVKNIKQVDNDHMNALMQAIRNAEICVFYQTPDLVYHWADNLPVVIKKNWFEGCRDADIFPPDVTETIEVARLDVLATGKGTSCEVRLPDENNQSIWVKFSIDCHRDNHGKVIGIITTGINVTELRRREQVLKILLREVSHRSKNLLAIMQSIAAQTARFSGSVNGFLKKFQGRIQSLSHSQDLVTDSNWHGALFRELIHSQAKGYIDFENAGFKIDGENPYLFPRAALHIGLAIHELIVNSASYGALASEDGHVKIECKLIEAPDKEASIEICWYETFPCENNNDSETKSRFGSRVLEYIVPVSVDGQANYEISQGKVKYCLTMPTSQFDL